MTVLTFRFTRHLSVMFRLTRPMTLGALVLNCKGGLVQAMSLCAILWTTLLLFTKGCTLVRCLWVT